MSKYIVDLDTGEVITEIMPGDRLLRKTSIDALKKTSENVDTPTGEKFIKLYNGSVVQLRCCKLSAAEYSVILFLATNLRYQSNIAQYFNKKLITRNDIQRELELSDITVKRVVTKLIKAGLLVEVQSTAGKVFILNPYVFHVGDTINKTVHDLFKKTKWARW